jgi:hypothetical protein
MILGRGGGEGARKTGSVIGVPVMAGTWMDGWMDVDLRRHKNEVKA